MFQHIIFNTGNAEHIKLTLSFGQLQWVIVEKPAQYVY